MPSASQLRVAIERQLSQRIPAALTPVVRLRTASVAVGIPALDELLGGFPIGAMTEVTGAAGSGRTALALAAVSTATQGGKVAAWVDVTCAFDPESACANGVSLDRLLWVRCHGHGLVAQGAAPRTQPASFAAPQTERVQHGGGSPHPLSEERGLSEAVNALLTSPAKYGKDRVTGTPGAANRLLQQKLLPRSKLSARIEQAGTDRHPSRRGSYVLEQRERFTGSTASATKASASAFTREQRQQTSKPWQQIDQALRVTDLLLQAGGFSVIVLDLADIAAEFVRRVPLATWFRFRAGAEHAQCALIVLTQHPCTGSSAALVLKTQWLGELEEATYFPGLGLSAEVGRQRFPSHEASSAVISMRKPPQRSSSTDWKARSPWASRV